MAAHWAGIWFSGREAEITEKFLAPFGFTPHKEQKKLGEDPLFLPLGKLGYGLYMAGNPIEFDEHIQGARYFELGAGLTEYLSHKREPPYPRALGERFKRLISGSVCKRRICSPVVGCRSISV